MNTVYHICPYCRKVITATYENEADYGRVITRSEKILKDHMTNNHYERYNQTKRNRSEYGEDDTDTNV